MENENEISKKVNKKKPLPLSKNAYKEYIVEGYTEKRKAKKDAKD